MDIQPASIPGSNKKQLRACLLCSLVQTPQDFKKFGCPNCEEILGLQNDSERVASCTSAQFDGLIAMMNPEESWVARWQRTARCEMYSRGSRDPPEAGLGNAHSRVLFYHLLYHPLFLPLCPFLLIHSPSSMPSTALVRADDAQKSVTAQAIHYARLTTTAASLATSIGFLVAENGTHLGFSVARSAATGAVSLASSVTERTVFGKALGTDKLINYVITKSFNVAEAFTLIPLQVGHTVANASLVVAETSIEGVSLLFGVPKESESDYKLTFSYMDPLNGTGVNGKEAAAAHGTESFGPFSATANSFSSSIPSLVRILQHEWHNPQDADRLPEESYSALSIARALVAWASIQKVTRLYHEKKWLANMKEIQDWEWTGQKDPSLETPRRRAETGTLPRVHPRSRRNTGRKRPSSVHVVSDVLLPNHGGEILTAEIGEPMPFSYTNNRFSQASFSRASFISVASTSSVYEENQQVPYPVLRHALRRFSRMVLGGYGGAGMILFGVQLPSLVKAGSITAGFKEDGKGFRVGYTAPTEASASPNVGQTIPPTIIVDQPTFNIDLDLPGGLPNFDKPSASGTATPTQDSIPFPTAVDWDERSTLEHVVEGAEQSDEDDGTSVWDILEPPSPGTEELHANPSVPPPPPSYWNVFRGQHDKEIFEAMAITSATTSPTASTINLPGLNGKGKRKAPAGPRKSLPPTSISGEAGAVPRFWVLTDHGRQQIVLVLRGTMTLHEVAIDLACDVASFRPATTASPARESTTREPSPPPPERNASAPETEYTVHQGMYALAKLMGSPGRPVQQAVANALEQNEGYELVLCGHSLGAGVCAVLGLMWGDATTCLTVRSSGLPEGRPISVFCFAPPCVMSPALSRLAKSFVTSFIYSHDTISRLSLGAARDLKRVTSWLCYGSGTGTEESPSSIIRRALMLEKQFSWMGMSADRESEEAWFLSLRKTLEANMQYADLFPPGRIIWAMRDSSFDPQLRRQPTPDQPASGHRQTGKKPAGPADLLRVFEIENVEHVFNQVIFATDMLSAHFVQNYDQVLHEYL